MITGDTTLYDWPPNYGAVRFGVMSLGSDRLSGSCVIGFEMRSTMLNVFTIMDVNRRRDY